VLVLLLVGVVVGFVGDEFAKLGIVEDELSKLGVDDEFLKSGVIDTEELVVKEPEEAEPDADEVYVELADEFAANLMPWPA
jgi:uncharacterized membrane protein